MICMVVMTDTLRLLNVLDQVDAERIHGGLNVIQVGDGVLTIYKHTFANKYTQRCGMSFLGASLLAPIFFVFIDACVLVLVLTKRKTVLEYGLTKPQFYNIFLYAIPPCTCGLEKGRKRQMGG